jgi:hypothetical protein
MNVNYKEHSAENKDVYYDLDHGDLAKFFANNHKSLTKVILQTKELLCSAHAGGETIFDVICRCDKLEIISLFIENEERSFLSFALKLFHLPCLVHLNASIKFRKVIHFEKVIENGLESSCLELSGSLTLPSDPTFAADMLILLFQSMKNRLMRISMSHVFSVSPDVIKAIADNSDGNHLKIVKLVDCGEFLDMSDFNGLIAKCPCLKVLILVRCAPSFGTSNISFLKNKLVLVVVNSSTKIMHVDLRYYKKHLGSLEYYWLEEEATYDQEDSGDYEHSSEDESIDY